MSGLRLRVLSYNIHKGFSAGRRSFVLEEIKRAIRLVHADLVFLQEVQGEHRARAERVEGWPSVSQFEYLADQTWSHYAYGKNAVYVSGHHGNAILSKYPIVEWSNINISTNPFESRGLLKATVQVPALNMQVHCCCVHMSLLQRARTKQLRRLVQQVESWVPPQSPLIIAGDFNDWLKRADAHLAAIEAADVFRGLHGRTAPTFPSNVPVLTLDRVYARGFRVDTAKVLTGSPWNRLSDHAALYAELVLPGDLSSTAGAAG